MRARRYHRPLRFFCTLSLLFWGTLAQAQTTTQPPQQSDLHVIAKDLTAVGGYKWMAPAEATGITGFGLGVYGSYLPVSDSGAYSRFTGGEDVQEIGSTSIVAQKGLPYGFDVGLTYGYLPRKGTSQLGGQVQYAIWEGGIAQPALAVRSGYTKLTNVNHPSLITYNVDVALSKGFGNLTPYGSIGYLHGRFDTYDDVSPDLEPETIGMLHLAAGLRVTFGLLEITPEYDLAGSSSVFNLRLGFSI